MGKTHNLYTRFSVVVLMATIIGLLAGCNSLVHQSSRVNTESRPSIVNKIASINPVGIEVIPANLVANTAVSLIDAVGPGGVVDLEVYELGNPAIINALVSAKQRGAIVHVILDATERQSRVSVNQLRSKEIATEMMHIKGGIDHVKLLITNKAVLMGGLNYGTDSSYTTDIDVELPSSYISYALEIFNTDWLAARVGSAPASGSYGPFLTGSAIESTILRLVDSTKHGTCYVAANYLSDWTVRDALVGAARRGVGVYVVLNPTAYGEKSADAALLAGGAHVELAAKEPYLHAKVLVCNTSTGGWEGVVGSANFSYDGMDVNHELDVSVSSRVAEQVERWLKTVSTTPS